MVDPNMGGMAMDLESIKTKNHYEILGLTHDATEEQIRQVYRDLARVYHPDSNFYDEIVPGKASSEQVQIFKAITAAYNVLVDAEKRAEYDKVIAPLANLHQRVRSWDQDSREEATARYRRPTNNDQINDARRRMSGVFGRPTVDEGLERHRHDRGTNLTATPEEAEPGASLSGFMIIFGLIAGILAGGVSYFILIMMR